MSIQAMDQRRDLVSENGCVDLSRPGQRGRSGRKTPIRPTRRELDASGPLDRVPTGWRDTSATVNLQPGRIGWRWRQERNRGNR